MQSSLQDRETPKTMLFDGGGSRDLVERRRDPRCGGEERSRLLGLKTTGSGFLIFRSPGNLHGGGAWLRWDASSAIDPLPRAVVFGWRRFYEGWWSEVWSPVLGDYARRASLWRSCQPEWWAWSETCGVAWHPSAGVGGISLRWYKLRTSSSHY